MSSFIVHYHYLAGTHIASLGAIRSSDRGASLFDALFYSVFYSAFYSTSIPQRYRLRSAFSDRRRS
jgi:hypothetical protein